MRKLRPTNKRSAIHSNFERRSTTQFHSGPFTFPPTGFEIPGPRKRFEGLSTGEEGSSLEVALADSLEVIRTYGGS